MLIDIQELERHPVDFDQDFASGEVDLGGDLRQVAGLHTQGRAQLVEEHHGKHQTIKDIRLGGQLQTTLEIPCARCLEPVVQDVKRDFELLYRPLGIDAGREEMSVTGAEAEIGYYSGDGILLEDVLREQVLLAVPIKAICRQDCRGLCPHCGKNLNVEQCSCAEPAENPQWSGLKDLREKLEH